MGSIDQSILPAVKNMKDFDKLLESSTDIIVVLDTRISHLKSLVNYGHKAKKRVFLHADMIQGLKTDDYGMEFLGQHVKPDGVISTRTNVIQLAKSYKMTAIQRMFLIDSHAIDYNLKLIARTKPDYVELLPGVLPNMIEELGNQIDVPIIAGGLIRTEEEREAALAAGACSVSTSRTDLWDF
ncbi:glycerol-3-phosphate responsive antiterminator [Thalassobacillus sp. CUG 92003]|uniref:glycerol-3-phosphate responsive antiterminator n=1 Tax=Thalassobacillus sp. CUG 92003 TaxID=2736641 RepID=UPI0015E7ACB5|nr:glycerol-3-phosphate responsive antiterminator [Thalassobacillus sp. CUG 92003]